MSSGISALHPKQAQAASMSKTDAIMLMYQAIDKIYRDPGSKSEFTLESAFYNLTDVLNKYLAPLIAEQSGHDYAESFTTRHKVVDIHSLKHPK